LSSLLFRFLLKSFTIHLPALLLLPGWRSKTWEPPVPSSQKPHGGWDEEGTDDGCVYENGYGHADAEGFSGGLGGEDEGGCDYDEEEGGVGDDAAGHFEAACYCQSVVVGA